MNRFVSRRSSLFFLLAWLLITALTGDAFNLDDLIPGTFVIHDEDDCLSVDQIVLNHGSLSTAPVHHPGTIAPIKAANGGATKNSHATLAIDQDSPSLANDPLGPVPLESVLCVDEYVTSQESVTSSEPLHLLHCTLLI